MSPESPPVATVLFRGLCLFHRKEGKLDDEITVCLVNARSEKNYGDLILAPHAPHLVFDPDGCDNLDGLPEELRDGCVHLEGFEIHLGDRTKRTRVPGRKITFGDRPKDDVEAKEFQWVAPLDTILRNIQGTDPGGPPPTLKNECLSQGLPNTCVTSRVLVGEGRLECGHLGWSGTQLSDWEIKDPASGPIHWKQPLTDWVFWHRSTPSGKLTVTLKKDGAAPIDIVLSVHSDQPVHAMIENIPVVYDLGKPPNRLDHFAWFYELFDPPPAQRPVPHTISAPSLKVPDLSCAKLPIFAGGNAFCPPGTSGG